MSGHRTLDKKALDRIAGDTYKCSRRDDKRRRARTSSSPVRTGLLKDNGVLPDPLTGRRTFFSLARIMQACRPQTLTTGISGGKRV